MKLGTRRSKFVKLLLKRFVTIETIALLVIMVMYFAITIPWAVKNALSANASTAAIVTDLLDNNLSDTTHICANTGNSAELGRYLKSYVNDKSEQVFARIELLLNNTAYTSNARAIVVELPGVGRITSITSFHQEDLDYLNTTAYQRVLARESLSTFSEIYSIQEGEINDEAFPDGTIAYSKNFNLNNINYTVTVFYDIADTLDVINSIYQQAFNDYVLLNTNNSIIYSSGNASYSAMAQEFAKENNAAQANTFAHGGFFTVDLQDIRSWKFVGYVSLAYIIRGVLTDQLASFIIVILTFFLTFYVFIVPSLLRAMRPVSKLTSVIAEFGAGNLHVRAEKLHDDEIGKLIDVFNAMTEQINTYIADIKAYQREQGKSHYNFLISQIDPHFLCNSMNMVSALIRQKRNRNAIELNNALIDIIRDRLRIRNTEVLDTVEQEVNVVNQYLKIASFMYENQVDIHWDVSDALKKAMIPKNVMQPVVENALLHGLTNKETGEIQGTLTIHIFQKGGSCVIEITDNGSGMSPEELARFSADEPGDAAAEEKGKHIALRNIKSRLRYIGNGQDSIFIDSQTGEGTTVRFVFPLIMENDDRCE